MIKTAIYRALRYSCAAAALLLVTGCGENKAAAPKAELIRSVKVQVITAHADAQRRTLVGEVIPAITTALSFPVSGRVASVTVKEGDRVKAGQDLAKLDPDSYVLNVRMAQAELANAQTVLKEKLAKLKGQRELDALGFTSRNNVRTAEAEAATARSNVTTAKGQLALAKHDLASTVMRAPAGGVISSRDVERFEDVTAGQVLFQLDGTGELLVELRVPEGLIDRIAIGDPVNVSVGRRNLEGRIGQIGAQVEAGNAYHVTVALPPEAQGLRRGMSAEVDMALRAREGAKAPTGLLIPTTALLAGNEPMTGYVFVFDPDKSAVDRRLVRIKNLHGNRLEIASELTPGTLIVVAGVAFLSDGQKVNLFNPEALGAARKVAERTEPSTARAKE